MNKISRKYNIIRVICNKQHINKPNRKTHNNQYQDIQQHLQAQPSVRKQQELTNKKHQEVQMSNKNPFTPLNSNSEDDDMMDETPDSKKENSSAYHKQEIQQPQETKLLNGNETHPRRRL